jgi:nucleotide-binding universal stress UspA family protein
MSEHPLRILVISNETVEGDALHAMIRRRAAGAGTIELRVIAPALNSRLRHWLSDEDEARRAAAARLDACLDRLAAAGIPATGHIGDADPVQAILDGLHTFAADEIVVATHPEGRSHWLARNLVSRIRARFPYPVHHVVVTDGVVHPERAAAA